MRAQTNGVVVVVVVIVVLLVGARARADWACATSAVGTGGAVAGTTVEIDVVLRAGLASDGASRVLVVVVVVQVVVLLRLLLLLMVMMRIVRIVIVVVMQFKRCIGIE